VINIAKSGLYRSLVVVAAALAACSSDPEVIDPPSFNRSERLEWACFDTLKGQPVPLSNCQAAPGESLPDGIRLHVLVTQSARGEVGAIDIYQDNPDDSRRVDNDIRVPGYTFPAVGEIPSAVVVPPSRPDFTYVANFGSHDITLLSTSLFRVNLLPPFNEQFVSVPLPEAPTDMVLSPDESTLFVTLPELGAVGVVRIADNGGLYAPTLVTLSQPTTFEVSVDVEEESFQKVCPQDAAVSQPDANTPITPPRCRRDCATATPYPWALEIDLANRRLLVTDASLPVIHVLDMDSLIAGNAGAELTPIAVGSPMLDVVLTPPVPRTFGAECNPAEPGPDCAQYLYGVDAVDGSVAVLDYAQQAILLVSAQGSERSDRIVLDAPAIGLALIASDLNSRTLCSPGSEFEQNARATQLRGVFIGTALQNGLVQFIDVWDMDATCRGGANCDDFSREIGTNVYIRRHRARLIGAESSDVGLVGNPSVSSLASTATVPPNGVTDSDLVPDLAPVGDCPAGQGRGFPLEVFQEDTLVCAVSDPWDRTVENWTASWEGILPAASGGAGVLRRDGRVLDAPADFCGAGVLGRDNVVDSPLEAGQDPEFGYPGDQLVIISELPVTAPEGCQNLEQEGLSGETLPIVFAIEEARQDALVLSATTVGAIVVPFETIAECYGELVQYEVAVRDAYVVQGSLTGLLHRVAEDNGRCVVDTQADVRRQARAFPGAAFVNTALSFRIAESQAAFPEGEEIVINFPLQELVQHVSIDAGASETRNAVPGDGTLPSSLRFNHINQRLYTVDSALSGVVQFTVKPLAAESFFE
jgi:hypothetical protein